MNRIFVEIIGLVSSFKVQLELARHFSITVYVVTYRLEAKLYSVLHHLILQLNCDQVAVQPTSDLRFPYPMHSIVDATLQATHLLLS